MLFAEERQQVYAISHNEGDTNRVKCDFNLDAIKHYSHSIVHQSLGESSGRIAERRYVIRICNQHSSF